ncbi:uncharacterized protein LOC119597980 [Penaeus monodon]|uniref:uncharacterized protein LOC119597980 n=1 Tax=Penaeus monodon TaxID=6687 RepID=UPI0018A78399|nr:uncharacterized protein LOC119597980 [Penaeus monodon]
MAGQERTLSYTILQCFVFAHLAFMVSGQCSGTETFEKVTRTTVRGISGIPLFSNAGNTVTSDCISRCRQSRICSGFLLNYDRESCFRLDRVAYSSGAALQPTLEPINFFEKICITGESGGGILKCAELCIRERGLQCRSAEYHTRDGVCRLSRQDRRTQPLSFRPASPYVQYIENQCAPGGGPAVSVLLALWDIYAHVRQKCGCDVLCQRACESEGAFHCRSFAWYERAGVCRLSGDDLVSAGPSALGDLPGATWLQRAPCLDLELGCTVDAMTVHLNTPEPFKGRLFSRDFPASCQSRDVGRTDTTLSIKFNDPECGVVNEGNGVYSNVVVVQHHPVIQRRGDKAIKLMCLFETSNKTVTDSFNFIVDNSINAGVATAIVNATAPSPRIRLRIVDRLGRDINGARLGEELFLRLELDDDSVYGILARNLIAKSGDNSNSIILLDERGCPDDPAIFPSLQPLPGSKSLQGKFEAFKFSEDQVVRFQVNVQFCLEECKPAQCGNILSYGRRRRSLSEGGIVTLGGEYSLIGGEIQLEDDRDDPEDDHDTIYHEMPLQKEIIVDSETVKPLRAGLLPEETDARRLAELVCTSREVLLAALVSGAILQVCIILTAIMCVFGRRRKQAPKESRMSTLTLSRGVRSPYTTTSDDSANTLKSLRTSLRD